VDASAGNLCANECHIAVASPLSNLNSGCRHLALGFDKRSTVNPGGKGFNVVSYAPPHLCATTKTPGKGLDGIVLLPLACLSERRRRFARHARLNRRRENFACLNLDSLSVETVTFKTDASTALICLAAIQLHRLEILSRADALEPTIFDSITMGGSGTASIGV
jgi:hypothetical protein